MQRLLVALLLCLGLVSGCVSRELVITSEPSGAAVLINDTHRGTTPMTHRFTHYQTFGMRLELEGYHPLYVEETVVAPMYEKPGIDFVSEVLLPKRFHDRREFHYVLEKIEGVDDLEGVLSRAAAKRDEVAEAAAARAARDADRESISLPLPLKEGAREEEEKKRAAEAEEATADAEAAEEVDPEARDDAAAPDDAEGVDAQETPAAAAE